jgi:hypothetical protein
MIPLCINGSLNQGYICVNQPVAQKKEKEKHAVASDSTKQQTKRSNQTPPPIWAENLAGGAFPPGGFYRRLPDWEKRTPRRSRPAGRGGGQGEGARSLPRPTRPRLASHRHKAQPRIGSPGWISFWWGVGYVMPCGRHRLAGAGRSAPARIRPGGSGPSQLAGTHRKYRFEVGRPSGQSAGQRLGVLPV